MLRLIFALLVGCIAGGRPAHAYDGHFTLAAENVAFPKILNITERNLQKGFQKHGADFGLTGNWSKARAAEFGEAVNRHINTPGIREIIGSYRGQSGFTHYLNPNTGVNVVVDSAGNYVTGYKLGANQLNDVITTGHLW